MLAAGCSLDDRSVGERGSEATRTDESEGSRSAQDGGSTRPSERATSNRPPAGGGGGGAQGGRSAVERGSGSGGGGASGSGGGGGEGPLPGGASGDGPDEDAGDRPDGSDAPDGGPDAGCTAGNVLQLLDGWVERSTNCAGIQGGVYVDWRDESFISVTLKTIDLCAEGFSNELEQSPFDASFTINLNEDQPIGGTASDYDAVAHGVVGFGFVVEPPDPQEYFGVMSEGVLYCTRITDLGTYRVALTDLHAECWNGSDGPTPDPRKLRSIGFYSGATGESVTFQFCVTDISALTSLE
jgi:hypothetical protein